MCTGGASWSSWRQHPRGMGLWCKGQAHPRPQEGPQRRRVGSHRRQWSHRSVIVAVVSGILLILSEYYRSLMKSCCSFLHFWLSVHAGVSRMHSFSPILKLNWMYVLRCFCCFFQEGTKATVWEWWWRCSVVSLPVPSTANTSAHGK